MQTLKEQIEEIKLKHQALIRSNPGLSNTEWTLVNVPMQELEAQKDYFCTLNYYSLFDQCMTCCCTEPAIFAYSGDGKVSSKHNIDELYLPI